MTFIDDRRSRQDLLIREIRPEGIHDVQRLDVPACDARVVADELTDECASCVVLFQPLFQNRKGDSFMKHIRHSMLALLAIFSLSTVVARAGDGTIHRVDEKVPNSYIVTFETGVPAADVSRELERRHGGKVTNVMDRLGMFAVMLENEAAAQAMSRDPRVRAVQENSVLHLAGTCRALASNQWALGNLNYAGNSRTFSAVYGQYLSWVRLYVIDGQIDDSSSDFRSGPYYASKVREVHSSIPGCGGDGGPNPPYLVGSVTNHGAAVASIIAGNVHGVVPQMTSIVSLIAADCTGAASDASLADAANYAINTHQEGMPAVANVSIASRGADDAFDNAMKGMVDNGIFVVVAAGNGDGTNGVDACSVSSARLGGAGRYSGFMAVGATTIYGSKAHYSNYGSCVDIWAPGGDENAGVITASGTGMGTSFAAPAVAGAAVVLYSRYPYWSPSSIWSKLKGDAQSPWGYLQTHIPDDPTCVYFVCDSLGCRYISYY